MVGMGSQRQAVPVWIVLFDRFVARWLFGFIALSVVGLALLTVMTHGWVHLLLSLPGQLLAAGVAAGIALLTRSPVRRRSAVICLLGVLAAVVPNLFGVGGDHWRGMLTGVLLAPVFALATRRALRSEPVDALTGDAQATAAVASGQSEVASRTPAAQVRNFQRPVLVLNPRSGSALAVHQQLLEAADRYGVEVREAATPTALGVVVRKAVADGADVLGVAGGDGSLAAVATVAIEAELPFVCVPAGTRNHFARDLGLNRADPPAAIEAFVAGPERRVDVATAGERLFLNNASPLSSFGARPRLDAGVLEVSALARTEGQQLRRALENLVNDRYQAGDGWARWTTTSLEVDSPSGRLEVGIDGEPVALDTPIEFRIHAGALRVLLPPARQPSGRPSKSKSPAPRRRILGIASTPEGRIEQVAGLVRLVHLLGRVGEREFGPRLGGWP